MTTTVPHRVVSTLPAGTAFSRLMMIWALCPGDTQRAVLLAERMKDSPTVAATIELQTKAAVSSATTTDAVWAAPLSAYGVSGEALTLLRGASIIGALEGKMRRVPFRTRVPQETGAGTGGAWIGEGLATPVAATAYATLTQEVYKAAKIVVLSRELLQLGDPDAERTVRETVTAGVAAFLDAQFLTPTVTLSAGLRPASITNGATAVTSTGTTAAQMQADLNGLIAAITTTGGALTWIMKPITLARIAATLGAAAPDVPRTLFGIPIIASANSPAQITLVDASNVLYSDDGGFDVSISTDAAIEMDTVPAEPSTAATVLVSLFQRNLFGVRVTRWLAYLRAQTGAVSYMTVAY